MFASCRLLLSVFKEISGNNVKPRTRIKQMMTTACNDFCFL